MEIFIFFKLIEKADNKFLKFQLSDCSFNLGYAYAKLAEYENSKLNYEKAKENFWHSYSEAKDICEYFYFVNNIHKLFFYYSIVYIANQYESLEANATIDSRDGNDLQNSLEYFNQGLKIYNKSINNKLNKETDEINKRLNNKIKLIQSKMNENNLQEIINKNRNSNGPNSNDDENVNSMDDFYETPKTNRIRSSNVMMSKRLAVGTNEGVLKRENTQNDGFKNYGKESTVPTMASPNSTSPHVQE
jgi:hypothetical protein